MKRVVLDTNVIVSFLTDRDQHQQAQAADLLSAASRNESALILPQIVVTELVYVLRNLYRIEQRQIAEMLRDLLALPGVNTSDEVPWPLVLAIWPSRVPDFADAVLIAVARAGRHDTIATFDRGFQGSLHRFGLASYW